MKKNRREYFVFLPNMLTLLNLFTGFLALVMADRGKIEAAGWLLVLALVWDSLDGNIARMFKNPSQLGKELDSLADLASFVIAPAFILARHLLTHISPGTLFILFGYLGAGAYRLARFNVAAPLSVKGSFQGLPTPAAAITLVMTHLACRKDGWNGAFCGGVDILLLVLLSFLMVSRVRYPKLTSVPFRRWRSFFYGGLVVLIGGSLLVNLETGISGVLLLFLFISPMYNLPVPDASVSVEVKWSDV